MLIQTNSGKHDWVNVSLWPFSQLIREYFIIILLLRSDLPRVAVSHIFIFSLLHCGTEEGQPNGSGYKLLTESDLDDGFIMFFPDIVLHPFIQHQHTYLCCDGVTAGVLEDAGSVGSLVWGWNGFLQNWAGVSWGKAYWKKVGKRMCGREINLMLTHGLLTCGRVLFFFFLHLMPCCEYCHHV